MRVHISVVLLSGLSAFTASRVQAQSSADKYASCPAKCDVHVDRIGSLTQDLQSAVQARGSVLVLSRAPKGGFVGYSVGIPPIVFDSAGRYLRALGRMGSGPGEFNNVASITRLPNDSVLIFDNALQRVSLFDPDLRFIRSSQAPKVLAFGVLPVEPPLLLFNGAINTRSSIGLPLHLFRGTELVRSFGSLRASLTSLGQLQRVMAYSTQGVWTISARGRPILELWDPSSGTLLRSINLSQAWPDLMPNQIDAHSRSPQKPATRVSGLWVTDSIIWLMIARADARWRSALRSARSEDGSEIMISDDGPMSYDTVIQAFDERTGRLLATRTVDDLLKVVAVGDVVTSERSAKDGREITDVWRVIMRRK